jgi:hypothetical protein
MRMRAEEYLSKLSLELHIVIAAQFCIEISNLIISYWTTKVK